MRVGTRLLFDLGWRFILRSPGPLSVMAGARPICGRVASRAEGSNDRYSARRCLSAYGRDRKFEAKPYSSPSLHSPSWPAAAVGVLRERSVPAKTGPW